MAKSKSSTALFDLLHEGTNNPEEKLQVPGWWSKYSDRKNKEDEDSHDETEEIIPSSKQSEDSDSLVDDVPDSIDEELEDQPQPFIAMDGERIRVSFTSFTGAITVFVTLVILLGVYELGRDRGHRAGIRQGYESGQSSFSSQVMDDIEAARNQPPATHVVQSLLANPNSGRRNNTAAGRRMDLTTQGAQWVRDYTYIVVQEFGKDYKDDATRAQSFLQSKGIATERITTPSRSIQLITLQGFNRNDRTQRVMADQLLNKVHKIGTAYFASGGGYRLQGYFKTLKNDSWTRSSD